MLLLTLDSFQTNDREPGVDERVVVECNHTVVCSVVRANSVHDFIFSMLENKHRQDVSHEFTNIDALVQRELFLEEVCCKTNVYELLLDTEFLSDKHFEYS